MTQNRSTSSSEFAQNMITLNTGRWNPRRNDRCVDPLYIDSLNLLFSFGMISKLGGIGCVSFVNDFSSFGTARMEGNGSPGV